MKLSSKCLEMIHDPSITLPAETEPDIFKNLGLTYREPHERCA